MDQLTFTFLFSKEALSFVRNSNSIGPGVLYQRKNSESLNDIKKGHIWISKDWRHPNMPLDH